MAAAAAHCTSRLAARASPRHAHALTFALEAEAASRAFLAPFYISLTLPLHFQLLKRTFILPPQGFGSEHLGNSGTRQDARLNMQ